MSTIFQILQPWQAELKRNLSRKHAHLGVWHSWVQLHLLYPWPVQTYPRFTNVLIDVSVWGTSIIFNLLYFVLLRLFLFNILSNKPYLVPTLYVSSLIFSTTSIKFLGSPLHLLDWLTPTKTLSNSFKGDNNFLDLSTIHFCWNNKLSVAIFRYFTTECISFSCSLLSIYIKVSAFSLFIDLYLASTVGWELV